MPSWYAKASVQGVLSMFPARQRSNRVFQTHITHSLRLTDGYLTKKWERALQHVDAWHRHINASRLGGAFRAVELGTGWFPITSVGLALAGARSVTTYDIDALADRATVLSVLGTFDRLIRDAAVHPRSEEARSRLARVVADPGDRDAAALLAELGIDARVVDARVSGLPDASVDLIVSTSTLEHIPPATLEDLFAEFRRIAGESTVMSHLIDLSDHYAQVDGSITRFNFLRYSERRWRLYNNPLHYQSRLRITDYRRLLADTGWRVVEEKDTVRPVEELHRVPVHKDFARYDEDDLRVTAARIVSRPA